SSGSSAIDTISVLDVPEGPVTSSVYDFCIGQPVTVTAVPNDPTKTIKWYDAPTGGKMLYEGPSYKFVPSGNTSVYALESGFGVSSKLVVSEIGLATPVRFEIQNVGNAKDYHGYFVVVSQIKLDDLNMANPIIHGLGSMPSNSVVHYNGLPNTPEYWGSSINWDHTKPGWILIIDPNGDVVDSVFWNLTF